MILALLASKLSVDDKKITLAAPGGIKIVDTKKNIEILSRTSCPKTIISSLKFQEYVRPVDLLTTQNIITELCLDNRIHLIKDYQSYIGDCLVSASYHDAHDFNMTIDLINSAS
jgi:hypothetical protein